MDDEAESERRRNFSPEGPACRKVLRAHGVFVNLKEVEGRNIGRSQVMKVWLKHMNSILKAFGSP